MDSTHNRGADSAPTTARVTYLCHHLIATDTPVYTLQDAAAEAATLRTRVAELQRRLEATRNTSSAVQPQSPLPAWARLKRVEDFPRDRLLFVSFSNGHYADLMMNWVQTLRVLEVTLKLTIGPLPYNGCRLG